ncbi:MAG: efflux RND transporter periplasmic adaptor subunit [Acetobacteraceae bacterium]
MPVSLGKAEIKDVPIFTNGIGTVQPFQSVLIRARVDGTLDQILFTEGQSVKPGDLLAVIDPRPYQALLDQALAKKAADIAALANTKRDLSRFSDLAKNDFASRQSVDTQNMAVSQALATTQGDDAAIATAKLNLEFTSIKAPIEGRVGLRQVDKGNLIHANDATGIVTINQLHPISVLFTLPQDSLPPVQQASAGDTPLRVLAFNSDNKQQLSEGTLLTRTTPSTPARARSS